MGYWVRITTINYNYLAMLRSGSSLAALLHAGAVCLSELKKQFFPAKALSLRYSRHSSRVSRSMGQDSPVASIHSSLNIRKIVGLGCELSTPLKSDLQLRQIKNNLRYIYC